MLYEPRKENKKPATDLAKRLYDGDLDDETLAKALQDLKFIYSSQDVNAIPAGVNEDESDRIGIWKKQMVEGQLDFVRDPAMVNEFVYWSNRDRIPAKPEKFRVVLLGESVARGFLVDPAYSPAKALQAILSQSELDAEVVDLARTNCTIWELGRLARQSLQLKPDVLIVFAGNNWTINSQSLFKEQLDDLLQDVDEQTPNAIKERVEEKLMVLMNDLFSQLGEITSLLQIPVVVINPEFNLKDWNSNSMERTPQFFAKGLSAWYMLLEKAQYEISRSALDDAAVTCEDIINHNPMNPLGYEMMAGIMEQQGQWEAALTYYRRAHDTTVFQISHRPGVTTFIQDKIREYCATFGLHLVDLPALFCNRKEAKIPDRQLFLDYCHLTVKGMNLAMFHTAELLYELVNGTLIPLTETDIDAFGPLPRFRSFSHFLTAIHNAHWGQEKDILIYHCDEALANHDIQEQLQEYVLMASSLCPWRLSRYFQRLLNVGPISSYLLLAQPEAGAETFDLPLVEAMLEVLRKKGIDIRATIDHIRISEHLSGVIDLLQPYYWLDYNSGRFKAGKSVQYREYGRYSRFYLIGGREMEAEIDMVFRLPYPTSANAQISIELNGTILYTTSVSSEWKKELIRMPKGRCIDGVNHLVIYWPLNDIPATEYWGYNRLQKLYAYMYPVIGEIHSLRYSCVKAADSTKMRLAVQTEG